MGIGPAFAIPAAVKSAGLKLDDINLFEINEVSPLNRLLHIFFLGNSNIISQICRTSFLQAFASQYVYCCKKLNLDPAKVNVNGGALALGHPLGATGMRFAIT